MEDISRIDLHESYYHHNKNDLTANISTLIYCRFQMFTVLTLAIIEKEKKYTVNS